MAGQEVDFSQDSVERVLSFWGVHPEHGLSKSDVQKRNAVYGTNTVLEQRKTGALKILLHQVKSLIILILFGAALIAYMLGKHVEFFVVISIVLIVILLGFFEEYKATREMEALKRLTPRKARVRREGREMELLAEELVPGDILLLRRGEIVAADARIISSNNLSVEESTLTGESVAVLKSAEPPSAKGSLAERTNIVFASGQVVNGDAVCVIVATGKASEIGKISELIARAGGEEKTPLQRRLDRLAKQFSYSVLVICAVIVLIGVIRGQELGDMMLLAVAVAVSGIPESLPAVISVALAVGMKRMAQKGAIIKRLPAVETLGTCTVICTDKTGTLTQNRMVVEKVFAFDVELDVTGQGFAPEGVFLRGNAQFDPNRHRGVSKIIETGTLCNDAALVRREREHGQHEWEIDGESTEGALIVLAKKAGIERASLHSRFPRLHLHPFDAKRKCMSAVHLVERRPFVYAKGAPETVLKRSNAFLENGKVKPLTAKTARRILEKTEEYAAKGLRVLALAYKEHKGKTYDLKRVESSLIFAGLVAMRDPPKEGVKESISLCTQAGTWIVMITGDNKLTAIAIAKELGIYEEGDMVLTGPELDEMDQAELEHVVENVSVYARATPDHKLRIVEALQKQGEIVAMTGDGVNDAPALKKADIGVAMGKRGTAVAKEASEMVITDDNFATIVTAIKEGRAIYSNIRKFVYYILAGNFSEVMLILIATLIGVLPPLTPIMILFINLVTSDIPALGLAVDQPSEKIMKQKPRDPKEGILSDYLLFRIAEVIPLIVLGTIALYIWELMMQGGAVEKAQTIAFVTLILFELFHVFNAKSFDGTGFTRQTFTNRTFYFGYGLSILFVVIAVYWLPAQSLLGTTALQLSDWVTAIVVASSVLWFVEIQKTAIATEMRERERLAIHPKRQHAST